MVEPVDEQGAHLLDQTGGVHQLGASRDALVDKSLVAVHRMPAGPRYRLLVPIREHAADTLAASGEAEEIALRHAHHYRAFASHAGPFLRGHDQADWDRRVDAELDHVRRAIATFTANGAIDDVLGVCFDLMVYWVHRGLHVEANEYLSAALDTGEGAIERRLQQGGGE